MQKAADQGTHLGSPSIDNRAVSMIIENKNGGKREREIKMGRDVG